MKSPKTGNDSLMVIWTTMILAVLEKEKRFSLYKEKCNMKKISLLFCFDNPAGRLIMRMQTAS